MILTEYLNKPIVFLTEIRDDFSLKHGKSAISEF